MNFFHGPGVLYRNALAGNANYTTMQALTTGTAGGITGSGSVATPNFHGIASNGAGTWVIGGASGTLTNGFVITSTDGGATWTGYTPAYGVTTNGNTAPMFVHYLNGKFWAIVQMHGVLVSSVDGITWSAVQVVGGTTSVMDLAYGAGLYVAIPGVTATALFWTSPDGVTWTQRTAPGSLTTWTSIRFLNGKFVAIASQGATPACYTSPDGITWTVAGVPKSATTNQPIREVIYVGGLYIANTARLTSTPFIQTSPDLVTWTQRVVSTVSTGWWHGLAYGNGVFYITDTGSTKTLTSTDGITWTAGLTLPNIGGWGIAFDGSSNRFMTACSSPATSYAISVIQS